MYLNHHHSTRWCGDCCHRHQRRSASGPYECIHIRDLVALSIDPRCGSPRCITCPKWRGSKFDIATSRRYGVAPSRFVLPLAYEPVFTGLPESATSVGYLVRMRTPWTTRLANGLLMLVKLRCDAFRSTENPQSTT